MRRPSAGAGAARMGALTSAHRERSGSQDSVSSVGSSVSTSSRSRVRLGVTSLNEQKMASSSGYGQKQVFYLVSKRRRHFEFFLTSTFFLFVFHHNFYTLTRTLYSLFPANILYVLLIHVHALVVVPYISCAATQQQLFTASADFTVRVVNCASNRGVNAQFLNALR